jgi:SAM-dependent methyltransferase
VIDGIPRMLLTPMREALGRSGPHDGADTRQVATAQSFGFEWSRFPEMRDEWERNFLEYMAPHGPHFFHGKRVLDAGCGSGRHAFYAAQYGATVWAIDLGPAVAVARRNTGRCDAVHVVQADLYNPPFAPESFDFIYSLGVLHHLPDPEAGFHNLLRYLKPRGEIQIFLYWEPEGQPLKHGLLAVVSAVRRLTTRLPYRMVHALSYPAAWLAFGLFVWPYLALRGVPGLRGIAERIPMKQYARYPFQVCVNDQFDRLSAPIENRYTKAEVEGWLARAGLEDVTVRPNCGWVATGRKPGSTIG